MGSCPDVARKTQLESGMEGKVVRSWSWSEIELRGHLLALFISEPGVRLSVACRESRVSVHRRPWIVWCDEGMEGEGLGTPVNRAWLDSLGLFLSF